MHASDPLPHWDMSVVYPGLDSPEFQGDFQAFVAAIDALTARFDAHAVDRHEPLPFTPELLTAFEEILERYNTVATTGSTLHAYITGFVATDSRNGLAQTRWSEYQQQGVRIAKLTTRLIAWIGSLDVEALLAHSALARDHAHSLHQAQQLAAHMMSPAEEALAAELKVTGGMAWTKLYNSHTSQLTVQILVNDEPQLMPMSALRNLAFSPHREIRRQAYEAELEAWENSALPIAAALNSLKGETLLLAQRRGWDSPLEGALFDNAIDMETLNALQQAAREAYPDFRRYLKAKAKALGLPVLAWYDLFAPLGRSRRTWSFAESRDFILRQFGSFTPALRELAERAFREHWIDAEPRSGKRDGAFCMWLRRDESRVLANYKPAIGGMSTLAHELGHAYHNVQRAPRTYLQRSTPMTLAETASIFCETLVRRAALDETPDPQEQLAMLDASLQNSCQQVIDIDSRFLFEKGLFEKRAQHELTLDELNTLMLDAQRATYGEGLDPQRLHPYMWAAKPHYYSSVFYNFPYTFGLLFGLGLYARYQADPEGFRAGYDELLSTTGMGSAAELAARFGIDLRTPDFWRQSLDPIREEIARFEARVEQLTA